MSKINAISKNMALLSSNNNNGSLDANLYNNYCKIKDDR